MLSVYTFYSSRCRIETTQITDTFTNISKFTKDGPHITYWIQRTRTYYIKHTYTHDFESLNDS